MKFFFTFLIFYCVSVSALAQLSVDGIKTSEAQKVMQFLTADSLLGRGNYTRQLQQAANYISEKFAAAGLQPLDITNSYFIPFGVKETNKWVKDSAGNFNPENVLLNIVGVLPGKTKPDEIIIFSAHYDHIGLVQGEVHAGANDNASGTTALLLLADYYAQRKDNERTIMFCAFAGEELGLLGSQNFAGWLKPEAIVTVINIEMIGVSSVGKNSFFITGADYSNLKSIFEKALDKKFKIRPEPSSTKQLFMRSDNYPFANKGVPAHSIMASDDDDRCYHQSCDVMGRFNLENMTDIIKAIVLGSEGIISGKETPSRVKPETLK